MEPKVQCKACGYSSSIDQNYCGNCGTAFGKPAKNSGSSRLIFIVLLIQVSSTAYWILMEVLAKFFSWEIYDRLFLLNKLVGMAAIAIPILLFVAVRHSKYKTAALVFIILLILYNLYWLVADLLQRYFWTESLVNFNF